MRCSATHLRPAPYRGHTSRGPGGHRCLCHWLRLCHLVALPRPMGVFGAICQHCAGVHGKPLQIAGKMQHLDIQWGEARGRASFIVIVGLELPPCLIGMDIMRPLRVRIDVTEGTATPAQPDPQTIHLNAAQTQPQPSIPLSEKKTLFSQLRKPQVRELLSLELPLPHLLCLRNRAGCQSQRRPGHPHQPLASLFHLLDSLLLTLTRLTLTLLAVLDFCRLQTFRQRQLAL